MPTGIIHSFYFVFIMRVVLSSLLLLLLLTLSNAAAIPIVYEAIIEGLNGSGVTGTAMVVTDGSSSVAYAGFGIGLPANVSSVDDCLPTNACGAHIHSGTSCESTETQGGHYYSTPVDPWLIQRYVSDDRGSASFAGVLNIGTDEIQGRTFLLHDETGGRIGCGVLKRIDESKLLIGYSQNGGVGLTSINDSNVKGNVVLYAPNDDYVCHYGTGENLQPDVVSFVNGGPQCRNPNGCGAHIHSGSSCADSTAQGGHYYDATVVEEDPWKYAGYAWTDSAGNGSYASCLKTGETQFKDKAFVLHGEDGGRVACGILSSCPVFRKCSSAFGDGYMMSRPRTILNALSKLFGSTEESCQMRCVPLFAVSISERLGFRCGEC